MFLTACLLCLHAAQSSFQGYAPYTSNNHYQGYVTAVQNFQYPIVSNQVFAYLPTASRRIMLL